MGVRLLTLAVLIAAVFAASAQAAPTDTPFDCAGPAGYPGVLVVHGGAANQEMYLWGSEGLAESGYMVMTFQIPEPENAESSFHYPDSKEALDWFLATPANPTKQKQFNPLWRELDHKR